MDSEKNDPPGFKAAGAPMIWRTNMPSSNHNQSGQDLFREAEAWEKIGAGWRQLHGSFQNVGVSIEWHDFHCEAELNWAKSFHPGSIEICLNFSGLGYVASEQARGEFTPLTAGFYRQGKKALHAQRHKGERHQFVTVEFSPSFLKQHLQLHEGLHPIVAAVVHEYNNSSGVSQIVRLGSELQQVLLSFQHPPVYLAAQNLWFHSKALELASALFFQPAADQEFFCDRQKRQALERVEKVQALLKQDLAKPLGLEEIGRRVGCSHFYLSRTFSKEMGMTIQQYLRQLRMEKAAELLKSGKYNVTQAAIEVGYSSLGHFSQAFHETFGCCPGLYPLPTIHRGVKKK